jgi:hypothetical protein
MLKSQPEDDVREKIRIAVRDEVERLLSGGTYVIPVSWARKP